MARDYLYKAKSLKTGEWVEGLLEQQLHYTFSNGLELGWVIKKKAKTIKDEVVFTYVDPNTICENTGLIDKNGTRVFEHDIIRYDCGQGVVTWAERPCAYMCKEEEDYWEWFDNILMHTVEVIGNKFDNDLGVQDEQAN